MRKHSEKEPSPTVNDSDQFLSQTDRVGASCRWTPGSCLRRGILIHLSAAFSNLITPGSSGPGCRGRSAACVDDKIGVASWFFDLHHELRRG